MSKRTIWFCDRNGELGVTNGGAMPQGWLSTPVGDICPSCVSAFLTVLNEGTPNQVKQQLEAIDAGQVQVSLNNA